jgi:Kazal-type serine protease inhibitor-like protein
VLALLGVRASPVAQSDPETDVLNRPVFIRFGFAGCLAILGACAPGSNGGMIPFDASGDGMATGGAGTMGSADASTGFGGTRATGGVTGVGGTSAPGAGGVGSGTAGAFGSAGTTGKAGTSGSAGTSGGAGTSGNAGTTGSGGRGGVSGTAGTTGSAGTTGTGGAGAGAGGRGGAGAGRGGAVGTAGTTGQAGTTGGAGTGGPAGTAGTTGTGGAGAGPAQCGGSTRITCPSTTQFCELASGGCATVDPVGVCTTKPLGCDPVVDPVCGCDGKSYASDCERQAAGISLWADGVCSDPTCPATAPQSGNSCAQGNIACVYSITTGPNAGCVQRLTCMGGVWSAPVVVCRQ